MEAAMTGDHFSESGSLRVDDEEALKWVALEKLPTHNRLRTALLQNLGEDGQEIAYQDVKKLGFQEKRGLIEKLLGVQESEDEIFVKRLRERIDRVGVELPKIEVRFEGLTVEAQTHVGKRALPTLYNFVVNGVERILGLLHLISSNKHPLKVLRNISGIIKPSRMTLLLGPPSAGKTTLLLALAGKLDKSLKVSGRITYNGSDMTEFVPQRTSAYISQHDLHMGELTVRETFDFSSRCQGVGSRHGNIIFIAIASQLLTIASSLFSKTEMVMELARREKNAKIKPDLAIDAYMKASAIKGQATTIVTDYILKILGLDICADTVIGDAMRRGISGGQKKRVTTGEMLVGPAKSLFMDEISTGLDTSTTYQIVKSLRQSVHVLDATVIVSLLQPAPETYELFDDLILLAEGQIVYQGPRDLVLDFFDSQGFKCPARKGVADFLQEVTSRKDQEQYWADEEKPYEYVSVEKFSSAFRQFHVGQNLAEEFSTPFDTTKSHPAALVTKKYGLGKWDIFKAVLARQMLLMKRDSFVYVFKCTQLFIMAAITMTVFLRTNIHANNVNDATLYMGALFFGLATIMFSGFAEVSMTIQRLPVFFKQRDQKLFPAWAYSISTIITRLPLSLLESAIWVFMTYYVIGFAPSASRLFRQFLLLFLVHQMAGGLFRFIAALSQKIVIANTFGSFALLVIFALGGFVLSRDSIHPWWIWGYWSSPMMYGQNALAVNEFSATRWQRMDGNATIARNFLQSRGLFADGYWYWIGAGAQLGYIIFFNVGFTLALTYLRAPSKSNQAIASVETTKTYKNQFKASDRANEIELSQPAEKKKGMVLPFKPLALSFSNVNYYVDMPPEMLKQGVTESRLQLLHDISSSFRPGVLTALMGVSGAGKTTLMDVLAGRKTGGHIEGEISISGYPKRQETFTRVSGYCEQNDIHSPNVTVYESLVFSAWLRLSEDVSKETRLMFVEEIMELVELTPIRDAIVGRPGMDGLSTEQRKRLTVAVELVANPSIIFMDEPTSGLDARAAAIVMRTVRNTVNTGRTVVCTIHQPSIDIFESFDELLLMQRGGRVIYSGPLGKHSSRLIEYFEAVPGVPRIHDGYNPATWMLEVTNPDVEYRLNVNYTEIYKSSTLYHHNQAVIADLRTPPPGSVDLSFPSEFPLSFGGQVMACLWKQHRSYWKNPYYVLGRLFFTLTAALMFGTMFWDVGSKRERQQDLFNLMGSMYSAVYFIGVCNAAGIQPVVSVERAVYYREKAAGMYSALPYAFAQVIIELFYVLVQAVSYAGIVYSMMKLEWTAAKFLWFVFFSYFSFLFFTLYGMMAVAITPNERVAAISSTGFYALWNLFSGFLIPRPSMPIWWRWCYWLSPPAWTLYGIITSQLGDITAPLRLTDETRLPVPVQEFLRDYFGYERDFLGVVAGVHVALVVTIAIVFGLCIKFLNFQRR
ncbi:ABC transporter G family member 37 isoform X1 [Selaginella moellendorffii]|uniref:ABC transporter G family member 37 isoform X1 n=1 Tax=Selaginella moellendorffii TaxID=88036 RepID=UPI000D1CC21C|nr:ABC transporter G family member 37 isoform X1 [Selaginella moellendorffii]|eukprot:XP_024534219.1 ABC transporter G family member 37 isoform X1 [Selaginella moellendorffii]